MSTAFHHYVEKLNELRMLREAKADPSAESPVLEDMDEIWEDLTEDERDAVRDEGWRAWPDQYAERTAEAGALRERVLWKRDHLEMSPREPAAIVPEAA